MIHGGLPGGREFEPAFVGEATPRAVSRAGRGRELPAPANPRLRWSPGKDVPAGPGRERVAERGTKGNRGNL